MLSRARRIGDTKFIGRKGVPLKSNKIQKSMCCPLVKKNHEKKTGKLYFLVNKTYKVDRLNTDSPEERPESFVD